MTDTPVESVQTVPEMTRPLHQRLAPLKWAILVYLLGEAGLTLSSLGEIAHYKLVGTDPFMSEAPLMLAFSIFTVVVSLMQFLGFIVTVILTAMWTYSAMKNLHIIGEPIAEMSPGWAVGWYFIPIANLFKPYQGMSQIWSGSHHRAGLPQEPPPLLRWWWACWIVTNITANISMRLGGFLGDAPGYQASLWFAIVSSVTAIGAGWMLLKITRRVTDAQAAMNQGGLADTFA